MTQESKSMCYECGTVIPDELTDYDCAGACEFNVFCRNCGAEINSITGEAGRWCGVCDQCEEIALFDEEEHQSLFDWDK